MCLQAGSVAPGSRVLACAPGSDYAYGIKSGTSMSTPLISGAAALMLEKNPALTNVQIKIKLKESARDMGLPKNQQGWGNLTWSDSWNCDRYKKAGQT